MIYQAIILQVLAFVMGYACGRHDVPAVDNFTRYGSNEKHQKVFHGFNLLLKGCYVAAALVTTHWVVALCCALAISSLFDPTIAIYREKDPNNVKPWYYLSKTSNWFDRKLVGWFGDKAGKWKLFICILFIIVLNLLLWLVMVN